MKDKTLMTIHQNKYFNANIFQTIKVHVHSKLIDESVGFKGSFDNQKEAHSSGTRNLKKQSQQRLTCMFSSGVFI